MPLPTQSMVAWQVCISLLQAVAIGSTLIRLGHRWQIKRMWWDDWIVIVPLIADVLYFTNMWLQFKSKLSGHIFVSFWFNNILFLLIIWVSRISLSLSIVRIFPPKHICRRYGLGLAIAFLVLCVATILMSALDCYDKSVPHWYNVPLPLCVAKRKSVVGGIYLAIAFDYVADILLLVSPLAMLWWIRLPGHQRRMVLVLFSCSIISLLASVFFSAIGLVPITKLGPSAFLILGMGAQLQAGVTLFVCNIVVVAMFFYLISKRERDVESVDSKGSAAKATPAPERILSRQIPDTADRRGSSVLRSFYRKGNKTKNKSKSENNHNDSSNDARNNKNPGTSTKDDNNKADPDVSATSNSLLELTSIYEDSLYPSGDMSAAASLQKSSVGNSTSMSSSKMVELDLENDEMAVEDLQTESGASAPTWSFPSGGEERGEALTSFTDTSVSKSQSQSSQSQFQSSQFQSQSSQFQFQSQFQS